MPETKPSTIAPFALRMPQQMRDELMAAAKLAARSLNAEIVARLEKSLALEDELSATLSGLADDISGLNGAVEDHDRRLEKVEGLISDFLLMYRGDERE